MSDSAADYNRNPTANNAATSKSTSQQKSALECGSEEVVKKHGFSKTVAEHELQDGKKLGYSAAIVLRYLVYKVREHGVLIDGTRWARVNLDHIASKYPYLSRSGVDKAIGRLEGAGACEIQNLNSRFKRPKYDRTRCYHVSSKWMNLAEEEIRYFDAALAQEVGVPAAAIHFNFMHWIGVRAESGEEEIVELAPATIAMLQPFSKATIKRAIRDLLEAKLIASSDKIRCTYGVGPFETGGSKVNKGGSKVDKGSSKVDETSSKVNNDSIVVIVDVLEDSSKTEPAAQSENSSYVQKHHDASVMDSSIAAARGSVYPTQDDSSVAPTLCGNWPLLTNLAELHETNRCLAAYAEQIQETQILPLAQKVITGFFRQFDTALADYLHDEADGDEICATIIPLFQRMFATASSDSEMAQVIYYGSLEAILGGFLWPRDHLDSYSHPFPKFIRLAYQIHLTLHQRAEERRHKAIEQEFDERRLEFASIDAHQEDRSDLTPAEKTRVFKQGLYSRNKVGGIHFDQVHRTDEIKGITKKALTAIQRIFALNPKLMAGELLRVMDGCLKRHRHQPQPQEFKRGVRWHARMGFNLLTFARNLSAIQKQIGGGPVIAFHEDQYTVIEDEEQAA